MLYPALSDEAVEASAEAIRAWSDVLEAWSAVVGSGAEDPTGAWQAAVLAGAKAQQASLRAAALACGSRLAVTPFGLTGLFASEPPPGAKARVRKTAQPPTPPRNFQSLAKPLGRADDLVRIKGVGRKTQEKLNALGVFHFWQIASLSKADVERLDAALGLAGRIAREGWVTQARRLAEDVPA